jgi:ribosomal protein L40E
MKGENLMEAKQYQHRKYLCPKCGAKYSTTRKCCICGTSVKLVKKEEK